MSSDDKRSVDVTAEKQARISETDSASASVRSLELATAKDPSLNPGDLTFDEDTAGGLGRHLGVFSCTMLIVGRIIGTGIFSTPSSILGSVGSVGASLMLWVLGFVLSFCGLFVWLEYGTMFPRSGGEKVYLEAVYKRPRYLATVIFAINAIILGFTASGCIVFANNILVAAGHAADRWVVRGIALGVITFVTILHGFTPRLGILVMNGLSVFKIVILLFVVISGWVVLSGRTHIQNPHANFHDAFAGSSHSSNDYATATFKVLNAYAGWSNVNYVLNDVKNPVRTLKIAGPLGLGICATLYLLANVAYFAAATKEEIAKSGVTVAALFFRNVFGTQAQRALSVFVALRRVPPAIALGNVITVTFAASRINQELAKAGVPLPFGNRFWASNWPTGKSPLPGLVIHLIPSIIVIIAPPPQVAYPFILDVEGYPQQIINVFIVGGLFWLRYKKPNAVRPFKVWWPIAVFFLAAALFLMIAPFLPPANGVGDTPPIPYYVYCLVGIGIMLLGVVYWAVWRVVLPRVFGYNLVPRKEALDDGTVVTLFSRQKLS
ncbi:Cellular Amino Acid Transporter [Pleurotus pulmonarius]